MISSKKILVVAKDPTLPTIMEQELQDEYEIVCTQRTGVELKDIFYEENPDFIILDVMMPNLDGIGVCLTIRQWSHVPIMMLSAWGTGSDKVCGLNLGSETYLTEPFGTTELKARICETMTRNAAAADPLPNIGGTGLL